MTARNTPPKWTRIDLKPYLPVERIEVPGHAPIEPASYFVTTGDAVTKARQLLRDLGDLPLSRKQALALPPSKKLHRAVRTHRRLLPKLRLLLGLLVEMKGDAVHLETDRDVDGDLLVCPKNPRPVSAETKRRRIEEGKQRAKWKKAG